MANNEKTEKTCCVGGPVDIHKTQVLKSMGSEERIVTNTDRNPIRPPFFFWRGGGVNIKRHCPSVPQNLVQSDKGLRFLRAICNCVCTVR